MVNGRDLGQRNVAFVAETPVNPEISAIGIPLVFIKVTNVEPNRLVPVIVTEFVAEEIVIDAGVKPVIVGRPFTNKPVEVPVPAALVTEIVAVVADVGMVALI